MEEIVEAAQEAWERFRTNYHAQYSVTKPGLNGSDPSPGQHMLPLRSAMLKVAQCGLTAIESYNNCGELPEANRLASWLENMGGGQEDFICTAFLLMVSLDANYLMNTGESTTALLALNRFNEDVEQKHTAVSILSRKPTTQAPIPSPEQEPVSILGVKSKADTGSTTKRPLPKNSKKKKKSASPTGSRQGKKKSSPKKARNRSRS